MRLTPKPRKLSKKGAQFIASFEGFRATPYNDAAGNATIGIGHLIHRGPVTEGDRKEWGKLTHDEALALLQKDAEAAAIAVRKLGLWKQTRFDALVSFVFNVGVGAFERSNLRKAVVARDHQAAAKEFLKWNKAGGKRLAGLTRRRKAERRLYLGGPYG